MNQVTRIKTPKNFRKGNVIFAKDATVLANYVVSRNTASLGSDNEATPCIRSTAISTG